MTVRALIRLSKDELRSNSPVTQRNLHLARAKHEKIPESEIVWYEDIGVSGYSEGDETKRGRFSEMLKDARQGDEVWAVSSDRFARDVRVAQKTVEELQAKGTRVVFYDLPLDFSKRSQRTVAAYKQVGDQMYRDVISEKTEEAVPTVRAKHIRWGRKPDLFEVAEENGRRVIRPSQRVDELVGLLEHFGGVEAERRSGVYARKLYRLKRSYDEWKRTGPWYVAEKYDERREEYEALKRRRSEYVLNDTQRF